MKKRIISIIVTFAIVLSACSVLSVSASEKQITEPKNFSEYAEMFEQEGYPALTSAQFLEFYNRVNGAYRFVTGRGFIEPEYFNFCVDEILGDVCQTIADETNLDLVLLLSHLPETKHYAEFIVQFLDIDTVAMRDELFKRRDEAESNGNTWLKRFYHLAGVYFSIIDECKAYCEPTGEKNCYEIYLGITLRDGTVDNVGTGIIINTATGEIYDVRGNGLIGTGYNFSLSNMLVYTLTNMWVRDFGFCLFYDIFSYTTPFFFYETRRIKFDYDGLEWMIQLWKGNYLVSNGAEVGIYARDAKKIGSYYDCANDEQMMELSMELYHGDDLIFSRPKQLHWWLTGFRIDDTLYPADTMTLKFSIDMKNEEMLKAFCRAIDKHYKKDMTYTVDGLSVNVVW